MTTWETCLLPAAVPAHLCHPEDLALVVEAHEAHLLTEQTRLSLLPVDDLATELYAHIDSLAILLDYLTDRPKLAAKVARQIFPTNPLDNAAITHDPNLGSLDRAEIEAELMGLPIPVMSPALVSMCLEGRNLICSLQLIEEVA